MNELKVWSRRGVESDRQHARRTAWGGRRRWRSGARSWLHQGQREKGRRVLQMAAGRLSFRPIRGRRVVRAGPERIIVDSTALERASMVAEYQRMGVKPPQKEEMSNDAVQHES